MADESRANSTEDDASEQTPHTVVIPQPGGYGHRFTRRDIGFIPVPYNYKQLDTNNAHRVLLKFDKSNAQVVIGLDIYGDIVLGRGIHDISGKGGVDIDLSNLKAVDVGVSRRHALIRPTRKKLFLIDLDSTNGSYVNSIPIGRGMAQEIKDGDTISLAGLSFDIEFVVQPRRQGDQTADQSGKKNFASEPGSERAADRTNGIEDEDMPPHIFETLPPDRVPYVKSLRRPPTKPVTRRFVRFVRKLEDDEDEEDGENKTD